MGLLLRGIEQRYPRRSRHDNRKRADYPHKRDLLGKIKKLHIVHASANRSHGPIFINMDAGARKIETPLTAYDADVLGLMDLSGWQEARDFIAGGNTLTKNFELHYRYRDNFKRLKTVSFGAYDGGRWARYNTEDDDLGLVMRRRQPPTRYGSLIGFSSLGSPVIGSSSFGSSSLGSSTTVTSLVDPRTYEFDTSRISNARVRSSIINTYRAGAINGGVYGLGYPEISVSTFGVVTLGTTSVPTTIRGKDVCPSFAIKNTIRDLFEDSKSLVMCSDDRSAIKLERKVGLTIIHQQRLESMHSYPLGPTRIYTTTKSMEKLGVHRYFDLKEIVLSLCFDRHKNPFFLSRTRSRNSDVAPGSTLSWASIHGSGKRESALQKVYLEICLMPHNAGDARELQLAVDIKKALDQFHNAFEKVDGTDGHWGGLKILVGDDIPACPCCGRRR